MNQDIAQVSSLLDRAAESIQSGFYERALDELGCVDVTHLDDEKCGRYFLLITSANFAIGEYSDENIDKAIEFLKDTRANDLFAEAKFVKAQLAVAKGKHDDAKVLLTESYAGYLRAGDLRGSAKALNRLAYVSMLSGNMDGAIENIMRSIECYQQMHDEEKVIAYRMNLAIIYFNIGSIQESLSIFDNICKAFMQFKEDYRYHYYLTHGLCMALKGYTVKAEIELSKTIALSPSFVREKAQYYEFLGWVHILNGNFKQAETALLSGLKLSMEIAPESALISQTKRLMADAYLGLKKYNLAQKYAEEALIVAEKINERAEIAACYRVFARVCLHNDERDKAKEWFRKAMDLFSMIKSCYELAVTRYLYATSCLVDNNERIALLYLAREYFLSEEIEPYIDKVNSEISAVGRPKPIMKASGDGAPVFTAVSPTTKKVLEKAEHFSPTDYTVFVTGPTGVGKDQLARYIHWRSGRRGEYHSFNCAAFPDTMIESELFGYCAGAFTDAKKDKKGLIELAESGTLCLNEIAETPLYFQAKLLDFLETKVIRPLGSTQFKKVDVRIIAATNQDLQTCMGAGRFRSDLYYRLKQIEIYLPPLSERREDIPALARHFLKEKGFDFSQDDHGKEFEHLCSALSSREWPGNVRELEYEIVTQYSLSGNNLARLADLIMGSTHSEREILMRTLEESGWNQREAARMLNMTEGGVRYLIKKHGLSKGSDA